MEIRIYQVNMSRDERRMCFESYSFVEECGGIDPKSYDLVFHDEVPVNTLEGVFALFNVGRPDNFKGHSLSVSDIVEIIEGDKSEFHYCDSFGWKMLTFNAGEAASRL